MGNRDRANTSMHRSNSSAAALHANKDDHGSYVAPKKIGPNQPCWCGSGRKLKKCHRLPTREIANRIAHQRQMRELVEKNGISEDGQVHIPGDQVLEALDSEEE